MCKHPIARLVGTSDGIVCRSCGAVFANFRELEDSKKAQEKKGARKERGEAKND